MPGISGIELARAIATEWPDLEVILSGYSHILAEEGSFGFELLKKPYSIDGLLKALRQDRSTRVRILPTENTPGSCALSCSEPADRYGPDSRSVLLAKASASRFSNSALRCSIGAKKVLSRASSVLPSLESK